MWLGHLDEFSDYVTQGTSPEDLKAHLADLYAELSLGAIPAGSPTRCPLIRSERTEICCAKNGGLFGMKPPLRNPRQSGANRDHFDTVLAISYQGRSDI
eukprot:gene11910-16033_t